MKKFLAVMLVMVMAFSMTGCGISDDKILGDWTVESVNGQSLAEYAASLGLTENQAGVNIKIEKEGKITFTSPAAAQEYTYEKRADGIEVKEKGKDEIAFSMSYDDSTSKFTYKMNINGTEFTYVCKKGTIELQAPVAADTTTDAAAATDAAQ